ncbi:TPA: PTS sugar transporter subunit IIA [Streptococcus agalactiae]
MFAVTQDILFIDAHSQEELFDLVSKALIKQHYVSPDYRQAVKEREREFPTGLKIDLKDGTPIQYAAIPHTETQYCLVDRIFYVKNSQPITFKHMINPEEECRVQDFFFIINSRNSNQSDILSNLITFFITKGNLDRLHELGDNKEKINHYLVEKGVF